MKRNSEIKQFFKKGSIFILTFVLLDFCLGSAASALFSNQQSGKHYRINHSIENDDSKLVFLGSSHSMRHYIPSVFEEQLGMSTYNSGVQGQSLEFLFALAKMKLNRHSPEHFVLNIDETMFALKDENASKLADLHPYYWKNRELLYPLISKTDRFIDLKMLFQSYRNNSTIGHIVKYAIKPENDDNGYLALKGNIDPNRVSLLKKKYLAKTHSQTELDPKLILLFEDFLKTCKQESITIAMTISPKIDMKEVPKDASIEEVKRIADAFDIPVYDYLADERFHLKYEWFKDFSHLNHEGAKALSVIVAQDLKSADN